jgi:hypothetical protein
MKKVNDLFCELRKAFGEQVLFGPCGIRGAVLLSGGYVDDQKVAVYGNEMGEPGTFKYEAELKILRAGLASVGVSEIGAYVSWSNGYLLVVAPLDPWETMLREGDDCYCLSEEGRIRRNLHLKQLTDLAWQAWAVTHDVSLPGPGASRFSRFNPDDLFRSPN